MTKEVTSPPLFSLNTAEPSHGGEPTPWITVSHRNVRHHEAMVGKICQTHRGPRRRSHSVRQSDHATCRPFPNVTATSMDPCILAFHVPRRPGRGLVYSCVPAFCAYSAPAVGLVADCRPCLLASPGTCTAAGSYVTATDLYDPRFCAAAGADIGEVEDRGR